MGLINPTQVAPVDVNLTTCVRTKEIGQLIGEGKIEEACSALLRLLKSYPHDPLPQHFLGGVIAAFLNHQLRRGADSTQNTLQLLVESGVISVSACSSLDARKEIVAALDAMATTPAVFKHFTSFSQPFQEYFDAVLRLRGAKFAHQVAINLLRQIEPEFMTPAYDALISCCGMSRRVQGAMRLGRDFLDEMLQMKLVPSRITCHKLIEGTLLEGAETSAESLQGKLDQAMAIYRAVLPVVRALPQKSYVGLICTLDAWADGQVQNYLNLVEVFDHLFETKDTLSVVVFNIALKAYAKLAAEFKPQIGPCNPHVDQNEYQDGCVMEEMELFSWSWHLRQMTRIWGFMKHNGVKPDTFTLNAFMKLFLNLARSNPLVVIAAMEARMRLLIQHGARMDHVTLKFVINTHTKLNTLKGVESALHLSLHHGILPDRHITRILISQCLRLNDPRTAIRFFGTLTGPNSKFKVVPDVHIHLLMMDAYAMLKMVVAMDKHWRLCLQPKLPPSGENDTAPPQLSRTIYYRVINSYVNVAISLTKLSNSKPADLKGILWRVQTIFRRLQAEAHIELDIEILNLYLKAHVTYMLSFHGRQDFAASYNLALEVYRAILESKVRPNRSTFLILLDAIAKMLQKSSRCSDQLVGAAAAIYQDMRKWRFEPNLDAINAMMKIFGFTRCTAQLHNLYDEFLALIDRPGSHFIPERLLPVFNSYLNSFGVSSVGRFEDVFTRMADRGVYPDSTAYRTWLLALDGRRANVREMWKVVERINNQAHPTGPPLRIDRSFLLLAANIFKRAGGIEAMAKAIQCLIDKHRHLSNLDRLPPQFYLSMLNKTMLPFSPSHPANQVMASHCWLIALAGFSPEASHMQAEAAYKLMVSSFDPLSYYWQASPKVLVTLKALKSSHIDPFHPSGLT
ncbi:hypothetical protein L0F63_002791 [Massospora cicadina]|nr:hypothetical protein L0F63_002791 [Massospora cicadina]